MRPLHPIYAVISYNLAHRHRLRLHPPISSTPKHERRIRMVSAFSPLSVSFYSFYPGSPLCFIYEISVPVPSLCLLSEEAVLSVSLFCELRATLLYLIPTLLPKTLTISCNRFILPRSLSSRSTHTYPPMFPLLHTILLGVVHCIWASLLRSRLNLYQY